MSYKVEKNIKREKEPGEVGWAEANFILLMRGERTTIHSRDCVAVPASERRETVGFEKTEQAEIFARKQGADVRNCEGC